MDINQYAYSRQCYIIKIKKSTDNLMAIMKERIEKHGNITGLHQTLR